MGDAGAGGAGNRLSGTLSLYENATVLTYQNTVRKDRRFHKASKPITCSACPCWLSKSPVDEVTGKVYVV